MCCPFSSPPFRLSSHVRLVVPSSCLRPSWLRVEVIPTSVTRSLGGSAVSSRGRCRDADCLTTPAQSRAGATNAHGAYLGYSGSKRWVGGRSASPELHQVSRETSQGPPHSNSVRGVRRLLRFWVEKINWNRSLFGSSSKRGSTYHRPMALFRLQLASALLMCPIGKHLIPALSGVDRVWTLGQRLSSCSL
jgi:hypothetical protein